MLKYNTTYFRQGLWPGRDIIEHNYQNVSPSRLIRRHSSPILTWRINDHNRVIRYLCQLILWNVWWNYKEWNSLVRKATFISRCNRNWIVWWISFVLMLQHLFKWVLLLQKFLNSNFENQKNKQKWEAHSSWFIN